MFTNHIIQMFEYTNSLQCNASIFIVSCVYFISDSIHPYQYWHMHTKHMFIYTVHAHIHGLWYRALWRTMSKQECIETIIAIRYAKWWLRLKLLQNVFMWASEIDSKFAAQYRKVPWSLARKWAWKVYDGRYEKSAEIEDKNMGLKETVG